jgi:acylphosphatase
MSGDPGGPRSERWLVAGRVQGVGFRWITRREAQSLGLAGWVRNLPDGRVELAVTGPPADLDELERRLRKGSRPARVDRLERQAVDASPAGTGFDIVR